MNQKEGHAPGRIGMIMNCVNAEERSIIHHIAKGGCRDALEGN